MNVRVGKKDKTVKTKEDDSNKLLIADVSGG
jgi:hypothetical protein